MEKKERFWINYQEEIKPWCTMREFTHMGEFDVQNEYYSSHKYSRLWKVWILEEDRERFFDRLEGVKKRKEEKEQKLKNSVKLFDVFKKMLDSNGIDYQESQSRRTNSCYITVFFNHRDEDLKYRFSDHSKGKNHTRFNMYTGERDTIVYDKCLWVKSQRTLDIQLKKLLKLKKEEEESTL